MFDNIGNKIKSLAKIFLVLSIIVGVILIIVGFILMDTGGVTFIVTGFLLPLIGWVGNFTLYAVGDIAEDLKSTKKTQEETLKVLQDIRTYSVKGNDWESSFPKTTLEEKLDSQQKITKNITKEEYQNLLEKGCLVLDGSNPEKARVASTLNKEQLDLLLGYGVIDQDTYEKYLNKINK